MQVSDEYRKQALEVIDQWLVGAPAPLADLGFCPACGKTATERVTAIDRPTCSGCPWAGWSACVGTQPTIRETGHNPLVNSSRTIRAKLGDKWR